MNTGAIPAVSVAVGDVDAVPVLTRRQLREAEQARASKPRTGSISRVPAPDSGQQAAVDPAPTSTPVPVVTSRRDLRPPTGSVPAVPASSAPSAVPASAGWTPTASAAGATTAARATAPARPEHRLGRAEHRTAPVGHHADQARPHRAVGRHPAKPGDAKPGDAKPRHRTDPVGHRPGQARRRQARHRTDPVGHRNHPVGRPCSAGRRSCSAGRRAHRAGHHPARPPVLGARRHGPGPDHGSGPHPLRTHPRLGPPGTRGVVGVPPPPGAKLRPGSPSGPDAEPVHAGRPTWIAPAAQPPAPVEETAHAGSRADAWRRAWGLPPTEADSSSADGTAGTQPTDDTTKEDGR